MRNVHWNSWLGTRIYFASWESGVNGVVHHLTSWTKLSHNLNGYDVHLQVRAL